MNSVYEVSISVTSRLHESRIRIPLKILDDDVIKTLRERAIAGGIVPEAFPLEAYERAGVTVMHGEVKRRTRKGHVIADSKDTAAQQALNSLMCNHLTNKPGKEKQILDVEIKQIKKKMTTMFNSDNIKHVTDLIKLIDQEGYYDPNIQAHVNVDTLKFRSPWEFKPSKGYIEIELCGHHGFGYYGLKRMSRLLTMGLLVPSSNITLEETRVQLALGTNMNDLFRTGKLSWSDEMLARYGLKCEGK